MIRLLAAAVMLVAWPLLGAVSAQPGPARIHRIYLSAVEFKGTTTRDKLAPPSLNPGNASRGYEHKDPGDADPSDPEQWEVMSYQFPRPGPSSQRGRSW
jgi:hypothetical protein